MNRRDELERLRIELKRKVDAIIDEAISRVEEIMNSNQESQHTDEKQQENRIRKQSENSGFQSSESGSDDSGSVIFDYSYMQQFPENESGKRSNSYFRDIRDVSSSSHPLSYSKSTLDESSSFTSPVLRNSSMKRALSETGLMEDKDATSLLIKSLSCVTPIRSKPKIIRPTVKPGGTPPHFWSLEMPPSPK
ncbi:hypothetical protein WA538_005422 [Blastocystis sp. DL]